jgi:hypothetical protein
VWTGPAKPVADDPATALALLQAGIEAELDEATPSLAHSRTPRHVQTG